ncbi:MAG: hypothetical protein AAGE65_10435 [Planctomycetota bacterium]
MISVALAQAGDLAEEPPYVVALLVLGVLFVTASMMVGLRNRKKRTVQNVTAREQLERVKQREGLKRDLESLAVEIEEMARRVGAQLDNKAARLEALIDQADATVQRLERARLAMLNPVQTAPASNAGAEGDDANPHVPPGQDRLTVDVVRLHAQGMSADQIAQAVGEDAGKVELILALQNAKA